MCQLLFSIGVDTYMLEFMNVVIVDASWCSVIGREVLY